MASFSSDFPSSKTLPLKPIQAITGSLGAVKDRLDYYYNQGETNFFRSKIRDYNSTVFRTNVPPGPFATSNSKVVAVLDVLDAVSFTVLFDDSKVEKKEVLVGTYMPSTDFTGGYQVCGYLDPSKQNHHVLKGFFLSSLCSSFNIYPSLYARQIELLHLWEVIYRTNGSTDRTPFFASYM